MIHIGDCRDILKSLDSESVDCIVTSPPYYQMQDYGHENQIGAENSWQEYIHALVEVMTKGTNEQDVSCARLRADRQESETIMPTRNT